MNLLYFASWFFRETKKLYFRFTAPLVAILIVFPVLLMMSGAGKPVGNLQTLALKSEQLPFRTKEFYIADVIDERPNPHLGQMVPVSTTAALTPQPVDLQGGNIPAIKKYIKESFSYNPKSRPVYIRLKEYKVVEQPASGKRVEGQIQILASFEVEREGKRLHLIDFKSGAKYARLVNNQAVVEPTLRKMLSESLRYLTTWVDKEVPTNQKLAREIKVHFDDDITNTADDTLYYDPKRPLSWSDFQGGSRISSSYIASIFPGVTNDSHAKVENGVLHVRVSIKAFMVRNLSKAISGAKDEYSLNHEQRHFDIAKLVAEHYKQRVTADKLTIEDYESIIQYQYLEALWEMGKVQEQYDDETGHGTNHSAQARWNKKIDDELRALKIKS